MRESTTEYPFHTEYQERAKAVNDKLTFAERLAKDVNEDKGMEELQMIEYK